MAWKEHELIKILQELYYKYKSPISQTMFTENYSSPTIKVFIRVFGSFKNACEKANVPHEYRKHDFIEKYRLERLGETKIDTNGVLMKIVEYNNTHDIVVEHQDKYKRKFHTSYQSWTENNFINPYSITVCGKGYIGNTITSINGKEKIAYAKWVSMLKRCYVDCYKHPTYLNCYVCDEWLCFETFEKWFNENYYEIDNKVMCLDKDILIKGNKVYSPNTCVFVPQEINAIFVRKESIRCEYPIGVQEANDGVLVSCISEYGKIKYLGRFLNEQDAFKTYKKEKERYIKEVADLYKNKIPDILYKAMYSYQVEITD